MLRYIFIYLVDDAHAMLYNKIIERKIFEAARPKFFLDFNFACMQFLKYSVDSPRGSKRTFDEASDFK